MLKVLWARGPSTVREARQHLGGGSRAYTTVMSLMVVMYDKGLVDREEQGKAFVYRAAVDQRRTLSELLRDLVERAFGGSSVALIAHLLDEEDLSGAEINEIQRVIEGYPNRARRPRRVRSR